MNMYRSVTKRDNADFDSIAIGNDRHLLKHLAMSDSEAAMFLGKSRQTLNNQLGPKKGAGQRPPSGYFKLSDIVILVSAARQLGRSFDTQAIRDYVDSTHPGKLGEPYQMLIGLLSGGSEQISFGGADTVVLVMPAFAELRARRPEVAKDLQNKVTEIAKMKEPPRVYLLSSTNLQARMAGQWLDVDENHCYGSDVVEHYLPTILVYRRAADEPSPFVLTESGSFVAAPRFMNHMVADCLRSLLPAEVSQELHPTAAERRKALGD